MTPRSRSTSFDLTKRHLGNDIMCIIGVVWMGAESRDLPV